MSPGHQCPRKTLTYTLSTSLEAEPGFDVVCTMGNNGKQVKSRCKSARPAVAGLQHMPCCAGAGLPSYARGAIACPGIRSHGRRCSRCSPVRLRHEAVNVVEQSHIYRVSWLLQQYSGRSGAPCTAMLTWTVAAVPPAITPLTTGSSVPSSTPFPLPYAFFPLAGTRPISACLLHPCRQSICDIFLLAVLGTVLWYI